MSDTFHPAAALHLRLILLVLVPIQVSVVTFISNQSSIFTYLPAFILKSLRVIEASSKYFTDTVLEDAGLAIHKLSQLVLSKYTFILSVIVPVVLNVAVLAVVVKLPVL